MASRWFLVRNAARKCIIIASRVPNTTLSPRILQTSLLPSLSPQIPHHFNLHRFLSNQIAQNDVVPKHLAVAEEEKPYEIDAEKFDAVKNLLIQQTSFESSLNGMDLALDQDFITGIIRTESISGENLIRFFNWALKEKSFQVTSSVLKSLVSVVCGVSRKEEVFSVWRLVREIGERENGVVNVKILNKLIVAMSKLGKQENALEVFDKFEAFKCVRNKDSYYITVEALCKRSCFDWAGNVCKKMIDTKTMPDRKKVGNMMRWLCNGKKVEEAHELYMAAMKENKQPPKSCVSLLVCELHCKNETVRLALEVLSDFIGEQKKPALRVLSAVVKGLCRMKDVDAAKDLVMAMIRDGPRPGNKVFNLVITGYCEVGEMGRAMEMLRLLESRGLKPDLYTYGVLISGYSNGGEMEEAMKIHEKAKKNAKLSPVMYHTLIHGYYKLEQIDKALKLLDEMNDFGVCRSADEYEMMIKSHSLKALDREMGKKLMKEMEEKGLHLNVITRALIRVTKKKTRALIRVTKKNTRSLIRTVIEMEKEAVKVGHVSSAALGE